jgi:D-alanine-D-alanine ligase
VPNKPYRMKRTIAIVAGGDSSEHDVSMRSAQGIKSFLENQPYETYIIEMCGTTWKACLADGTAARVDLSDFSFTDCGRRVHPDFAYITIHGTPGENGIVQGYFDLIDMPYSTSDVLVEAMTFNKYALNQFLRSQGINISDSVLVRRKQKRPLTNEQIVQRLGLPCFVKPNAGGSSFGVTKVKEADALEEAIQKAMAESPEVMVEAYMKGTEITCGCYVTSDKSCVFPITEVVTDNEFFDYNAKYNGQVSEITPARLSPETTERVKNETLNIYRLLGCRGIIRIDYILTGEKGNEKINMLEINTTPGMTATSFIPQQIRAAGREVGDVLAEIIEDTIENC